MKIFLILLLAVQLAFVAYGFFLLVSNVSLAVGSVAMMGIMAFLLTIGFTVHFLLECFGL